MALHNLFATRPLLTILWRHMSSFALIAYTSTKCAYPVLMSSHKTGVRWTILFERRYWAFSRGWGMQSLSSSSVLRWSMNGRKRFNRQQSLVVGTGTLFRCCWRPAIPGRPTSTFFWFARNKELNYMRTIFYLTKSHFGSWVWHYIPILNFTTQGYSRNTHRNIDSDSQTLP